MLCVWNAVCMECCVYGMLWLCVWYLKKTAVHIIVIIHHYCNRYHPTIAAIIYYHYHHPVTITTIMTGHHRSQHHGCLLTYPSYTPLLLH